MIQKYIEMVYYESISFRLYAYMQACNLDPLIKS